ENSGRFRLDDLSCEFSVPLVLGDDYSPCDEMETTPARFRLTDSGKVIRREMNLPDRMEVEEVSAHAASRFLVDTSPGLHHLFVESPTGRRLRRLKESPVNHSCDVVRNGVTRLRQ